MSSSKETQSKPLKVRTTKRVLKELRKDAKESASKLLEELNRLIIAKPSE